MITVSGTTKERTIRTKLLDIGNGFYVNYAHMQPGSVRPKQGGSSAAT